MINLIKVLISGPNHKDLIDKCFKDVETAKVELDAKLLEIEIAKIKAQKI
jgi:hypothetical protein